MCLIGEYYSHGVALVTYCDNRPNNLGCPDLTRKHSCMIHTTHLQTAQASVLVVTHQMLLGGRSLQMNKFEKVSSVHHHTSLAGDPQAWVQEVPDHVTYPMMHLMLLIPLPPWTDRCLWKHYCLQLHLLAVTTVTQANSYLENFLHFHVFLITSLSSRFYCFFKKEEIFVQLDELDRIV